MNINYEFKNKNLLKMALTHISYAKEREIESNQRLEFLGDSVLSFVIAAKLYELHPDVDEGVLTEMRAFLVCEKTLAELSRKMNIGQEIIFSKTELKTDGKHKDSILADTFEAVLGAIYLDSDIETSRKWVLDVFGDLIYDIEYEDVINYKSALQNFIQGKYKDTKSIRYKLVSKKGPDHRPSFVVEVYIDNTSFGKGEGLSMKDAEKAAAREAYFKLTGK